VPREIDWSPAFVPWTRDAYASWWKILTQPFDRDLGLAVLLCLLSLFLGDAIPVALRGLNRLVGYCWLASLLVCASLDRLYLSGQTARHWIGPSMLLIWEPLLLTLGILCFLCLFLQIIQRLGVRWPELERRPSQ
jgi:hypothetical protein